MKKMLLIGFLVVSANVRSQCLNNITTNPAAPNNPQLPSQTNYYFNWQNQYWANNTTCQPLSQIESPFFKTDNLEVLRSSKDMSPADGWELIRRDFGYTDNNTLKPEAPQHAYFILYNKFTGILRVLLKTCGGVDYNGTKIKIKFDATSTFQTALLDFTGPQKALNQPHVPNPVGQSVTPYVNDQSKWFYADFPTNYDPCTCNYSSKINVISELIQSSSIALEGSITGTITSITNGQGSVNNDGSYSFKDFTNDADKFSKVYSGVDNFITQTKNVATTIPNSTGVVTALTNLQTGLKDNQFLKTGLAAVPWLKSAVSLLDLFTGGGKTAPQLVQLMPLAVNLSMKVNGTITTANQYHNIIFTTPGALNAQNDPAIYPFYNEVLGVFNLINAPTMLNHIRVVREGSPRDGFRMVTYNKRKLKEQIKWVVNPASQLELQDAQVAYVINSNNTSATPPATFSSEFAFLEGKDAATGRWQYRTEYADINCLGTENLFSFSQGDGSFLPSNWRMKFILNFRRLDNPNAQNVLIVLTFPIVSEAVQTAPTGSGWSATRCNGGALAQATAGEVSGFCSSTAYTTSRAVRVAAPGTVTAVDTAVSHTISVSPNPAQSFVKVSGDTKDRSIRTIQLSNLSGQVVYTDRVKINGIFSKEILVNHLPPGLYFLRVEFDKGKAGHFKVLVTK